jgi:hypothetical protein
VIPTTIKHGDLCIDFQEPGSVQIVRQSNATGIVLSLSEWQYLILLADIHGWPIAPPNKTQPEMPT